VTTEFNSEFATSGSRRADVTDLLLRTTNLTMEQLDEARRDQSVRGGQLIDHLIANGHVTADEVMQALGTQLGLPIRGKIESGEIDVELIERVPITFAKEHGVLPLSRAANGRTHA